MREGKMKRNLVTVCFATIGAALALIAISQAASTGVSPGPPAHHSKRVVRGRFSVLRSAKLASASPETALPTLSANHFTEPDTLMSELELEPDRATYVAIGSTEHGWVIPGRKGMCLAVRGAISIVSTCDQLSGAEHGGLVMVRQASAGPVFYGLVPDGASVTITNKDGSTSGVPVASDVFTYADPTAQSISVRPVGGSATTTPVS
jgi:hypothetical protein